jgi:hypothetical protein
MLKISATDANGQRLPLVDGGCTTWTQQLLSDRKERLLVSGIGLSLLASRNHPADVVAGAARAAGFPVRTTPFVSSNRMGLVNLDRLVVTPSHVRSSRPSRTPPVKDVGERVRENRSTDRCRGGRKPGTSRASTSRTESGASRRPDRVGRYERRGSMLCG